MTHSLGAVKEPLVASLLLVTMPGAPSSFLLLVAMPGAPSSLLSTVVLFTTLVEPPNHPSCPLELQGSVALKIAARRVLDIDPPELPMSKHKATFA